MQTCVATQDPGRSRSPSSAPLEARLQTQRAYVNKDLGYLPHLFVPSREKLTIDKVEKATLLAFHLSCFFNSPSHFFQAGLKYPSHRLQLSLPRNQHHEGCAWLPPPSGSPLPLDGAAPFEGKNGLGTVPGQLQTSSCLVSRGVKVTKTVKGSRSVAFLLAMFGAWIPSKDPLGVNWIFLHELRLSELWPVVQLDPKTLLLIGFWLPSWSLVSSSAPFPCPLSTPHTLPLPCESKRAEAQSVFPRE
ncbi:hypothetical protein E2320_009421, partial [Naja naja]